MKTSALRSVAWHQFKISAKTHWIFVQLTDHAGAVGCGEASLAGQEDAVLQAAAHLRNRVLAANVADPGAFAAAIHPVDLAQAAVVSAVDQALWDLRGQAAGRSIAELFGGVRREQIGVYANINRRTENRTPEGFAQSARDALSAGHVAVKIAPFDEVTPALCAHGDGADAMHSGLDRIAAVRTAIGPQCRLMVDCHWRFDEATARQMVHACTPFDLHWIECPLPEIAQHIKALVRLRKQANSAGVRLAGMEQGIRYAAFQPYCEAGAYDVMMPDVKYVGGLQEMLHVAEQLARQGVAFSPHNPSGPICHAASLQMAAAAADFDLLETQFDETPLFAQLAEPSFGPVHSGRVKLPSGAGLGHALVAARVDALVSDRQSAPPSVSAGAGSQP